MIKREINIFFTAWTYFTRFPGPKSISCSEDSLGKSSTYLPLVGWLVGAITMGVFWFGMRIFLSVQVGVMLSIAASVLATGALHEDGFADFCDAFGGGWNKEQTLGIMKDSRLGSYGAIGVWMILTLKFVVLSSMFGTRFGPVTPVVLICGHTISRLAATSLIFTMHYVREGDESKARALAKRLSFGRFLFATVIGIAPLFLLPTVYYALAVIPVLGVTVIMGLRIQRRLGGYTGDCLGATQQVAEVVFYLTLLFNPLRLFL